MPGYVPPPYTLAKPIEKVILDNEEKSTTYAETGDTGLLLGTVKLPAPKTHYGVGCLTLVSAEVKNDSGVAGLVQTRFYDGTAEMNWIGPTTGSTSWNYTVGIDMSNSFTNIAYSLKGATTLEFRVYLIGDAGNPNAKHYCRNLVVTVVPLYKV